MDDLLQFLFYLGLLMLILVSVACLAVTYKIFLLLKKSDEDKTDTSQLIADIKKMIDEIKATLNGKD